MLDNQEIKEHIAALEAFGEFRVLRRLDPGLWDLEAAPEGTQLHTGLFLDVETSGLNTTDDDVIELAMVSFLFDREGTIYHARQEYSGFQDSAKLTPEITEITGITAEMIRGQEIDRGHLEEILGPVNLVVSHHADFDRKFAERLHEGFRDKPWACSMEQVPWAKEGFHGSKSLSFLAMMSGFFFEAHHAIDDCWAGVELLATDLPKSGRPALTHLLEAARKPTWRIWAANLPFKEKDRVKAKGYRWSSGEDELMPAKCWYFDAVDEDQRDAEVAWLRTEIFGKIGSSTYNPRIDRINAYHRFAVRDWRQGNWPT